jgi:hypothetical protein
VSLLGSKAEAAVVDGTVDGAVEEVAALDGGEVEGGTWASQPAACASTKLIPPFTPNAHLLVCYQAAAHLWRSATYHRAQTYRCMCAG